MTEFVRPAYEQNELIKYTIYDNPMFTEKIINETINDYPMGVDDPQFRREYLCESASDSEIVVIPEFDETLEKDIVRHYDAPAQTTEAINDTGLPQPAQPPVDPATGQPLQASKRPLGN